MACEICEILKKNDYIIHKTKYWRVSLSSKQTYLGRCYITLLRHSPDLAELTKEEWDDFIQLIKNLEKAIRLSFNPDVFNWFCQMNDSFKKSPPNPHVHWHLRPRYKQKVKFNNQFFEDLEFGHPHSDERERNYPDNILQGITDLIKKSFLIY